MDPYHVEALFWDNGTTVHRYRSQDSTILNSDRYSKQGHHERTNIEKTTNQNTFLLRTNATGQYWKVTEFVDPRRAHVAERLTEQEAIDLWGKMTSNGTSPDKKDFAVAFPGYTIIDV